MYCYSSPSTSLLRPITAVTDQLLLNKNVSGCNTKYILEEVGRNDMIIICFQLPASPEDSCASLVRISHELQLTLGQGSTANPNAELKSDQDLLDLLWIQLWKQLRQVSAVEKARLTDHISCIGERPHLISLHCRCYAK